MTKPLPDAGVTGVLSAPGGKRRCRKCNKTIVGYVPDPCLGLLPGVSHACCGHGKCQPYVVIGGTPDQDCSTIPDKRILTGLAAKTFFSLMANAETA